MSSQIRKKTMTIFEIIICVVIFVAFVVGIVSNILKIIPVEDNPTTQVAE